VKHRRGLILLGHAIGLNHFNPSIPYAIMNENYIKPLMTDSASVHRDIKFPYVVPRLSLDDIAAARKYYGMYT
jgi:hypothetical protein